MFDGFVPFEMFKDVNVNYIFISLYPMCDINDTIYSVKFLLPIYVVRPTSEKYIITEKQFKYIKHLQKVLAGKIDISILVVGSELELSKDLTLKYFDETSYIEVPQRIDYFSSVTKADWTKLVEELTHKCLVAYIHAKTMNPDMILVMKSNHFIPYEWIEEVVAHDKMNTGVKNFYGMSLDNTFILTCMDDNEYIDKTKGIILGKIGDHPPRHGHQKNKNIGEACLIGIPRQIYLKDKNKPERTRYCQENRWQESLIALGHKFHNTQKRWIFNIKSYKDDRENHSGFHAWVQRGNNNIGPDWILASNITGVEEFVTFFNKA